MRFRAGRNGSYSTPHWLEIKEAILIDRIKLAAKRAFCNHVRKSTRVVLTKGRLEVSSVCKDCGKPVEPDVGLSEGYKHYHMERSMKFSDADTEILFES